MASTFLLPYHQDERLDDDAIRPPDGRDVTVLDPEVTAGDRWSRLQQVYAAVRDAVEPAVRERSADPGTTVTVLSGDCLAALGTLAGVQRAGIDPGLVWLDAHGDVHTLASSTSGYLGGMALRMVVGGDADRLAGPLGLRPLAEERVTLVDARDLDPAEREYLAMSAIRRVAVPDVQPDPRAGPVVVHLDLDVVDPEELAGLLVPAPDGPAGAPVVAAVHRLLDSGRVVALSIACPWHPARSPAEAEERSRLLAALLA